MILFKVDTSKLDKDMEKISQSLVSLPSKRNMENIARASSAIAAQKFIKDVNAYSRANKKSMHHMYEWNSTGRDSARLFKLRRNPVVNNRADIDIILKKSKVNSPIAKVLARPGRTGKSVVRSGVFRDKAQVMESGTPVSFIATRNIAFTTNKRNIIFRGKGTNVVIQNPGGKQVVGSMAKFAKRWERSSLAPAVRSTRIFEKIEKDIAKTMSMKSFTSADISSCIKKVCDKFDNGTREF